ncbi:ADP-ribosyltransferase [Emticicia agri]|uniref:ADP ribosyltransferase domain-containing protein n=1 Tax=Emticicia agri TaxID=2492393 RepID=A0A4Q5LNW2_9BACT|nr:hypothetical protein EWM59_27100 [Emticicia agri]
MIYKYTDDGFESLNEQLRESKGEKISDFGEHLKNVLEKIPSEPEGNLAFRGAYLTQKQLDYYINAFNNDENIEEYSFISASTSELVAWQFGKVRFRIFCDNWKNISPLAKFINEKEVVLCYGKKFRVLDYDFQNGIHEFTMIEL